MGLITGLGEGIIWLIQSTLLDMDISSVYIDVDQGLFTIDFFGLFEINVNVGGVAAFLFGTAAGGPLVGLASFVIGNVTVGAMEDLFGDKNFYLPIYAISPFEIFAGVIPALNVNFIDTNNNQLGGVLSTSNTRWFRHGKSFESSNC